MAAVDRASTAAGRNVERGYSTASANATDPNGDEVSAKSAAQATANANRAR